MYLDLDGSVNETAVAARDDVPASRPVAVIVPPSLHAAKVLCRLANATPLTRLATIVTVIKQNSATTPDPYLIAGAVLKACGF
jgi:hypothetical protein